MKTLGERVKQLVDLHNHGSAYEAAKDLGVTQPTIARLISGVVSQPRAGLIRRIAEYYRVSVDWLLTGQGSGPQTDSRGVGRDLNGPRLRWEGLLDRLTLPPDVREPLSFLPEAPVRAVITIAADKKPFRSEAVARATSEAARMQSESWYLLFSHLADYLGVEEFRNRLSKFRAIIPFAFSYGSMEPVFPELFARDKEAAAKVGARRGKSSAARRRRKP